MPGIKFLVQMIMSLFYIKKLDVGEFEWQVIAYSYAKDGFQEQHSKVAIGTFSIEFEKPKKIKTKDPGRLYAQ